MRESRGNFRKFQEISGNLVEIWVIRTIDLKFVVYSWDATGTLNQRSQYCEIISVGHLWQSLSSKL